MQARAPSYRGCVAISGSLLVILVSALASAAPGPQAIVDRAVEHQVFNLAGAELQMSMFLRERQGDTRERRMFTQVMTRNDLTSVMTRFLSPPDVKGTSFLFLENADRDDDQHMYLPVLRTVKRIVGSQKNTSFMGSDFTYADLESRDLKRATARQLPDENVGRAACYVVESVPRSKEAYSKLESWIRKKDFVFLRIKYYDRKGRPLKTMFVKQIRRVGAVKVPTKYKLTNHQTGHATLIAIGAIKERTDFTKDHFTVRVLKKR